MQTVAAGLLADLCFIDQRDDAHAFLREEWYTYGKLGVQGPFVQMFGDDRSCRPEVASVFAEQAHRLGYLPDVVTQSSERLDRIAGQVNAYDSEDLTRSETEQIFGEPSMVIENRVLCFAAEDPSRRWVFVDLWPQPLSRYQGHVRPDTVALEDPDPFVRAIRTTGRHFDEGITLTAFGKFLRWGPRWWIDHPSPSASAEQAAIAAQLRQIADADPSQ